MNWILKWKIKSKQQQLIKEKEKLRLLETEQSLNEVLDITKKSQEDLLKSKEENVHIEPGERFIKLKEGKYNGKI